MVDKHWIEWKHTFLAYILTITSKIPSVGLPTLYRSFITLHYTSREETDHMIITKSLKLTAGPLMMLWHNQPKIRPGVHPARGRLEKETKFSQTRSIGSANQHACAKSGEGKHYSHVMVEENPKTTSEQIDKSGQKPICKDNFLTAETQIYLFLTEDLGPLKYR